MWLLALHEFQINGTHVADGAAAAAAFLSPPEDGGVSCNGTTEAREQVESREPMEVRQSKNCWVLLNQDSRMLQLAHLRPLTDSVLFYFVGVQISSLRSLFSLRKKTHRISLCVYAESLIW